MVGLTADEASRAAAAARLFANVSSAADRNAPADTSYYTPADEQRLRSVAAQYQGRDTLSPSEEMDLLAAARPTVIASTLQSARRSGDAAFVIPAHSVRSYTFPAYCLDRHAAAPSRGEEMQLVGADSLLPPDLLPIYRGLLRNTAQTGLGHNGLVQGLVWNLRQFASHERSSSISLSPAQQQALQAADPNALSIVENYVAQADADEQGKKALQQLLRLGGSQMNRLVPGASRLLRTTNAQALSNVRQSMGDISRRQSSEPVVGGYQGYTLLGSALAAHATSLGGFSGVRVEVANPAGGPAVFVPGTCVGQAGRRVQRMGIQANTPSTSGLSATPAGAYGSPAYVAQAIYWYAGTNMDEHGRPRPPIVFVQGPALAVEIPFLLRAVALLTGYGIAQKPAQKAVSRIIGDCSSSDTLYNDSEQGNRPAQPVVIANPASQAAPPPEEDPEKKKKLINITEKIKRQLEPRGWTQESVQNTVDEPYTTRPSLNRDTNNPATAYFNIDGSHVVRDDITNDIIQVSDRTRAWIPDQDIINPYIPQ